MYLQSLSKRLNKNVKIEGKGAALAAKPFAEDFSKGIQLFTHVNTRKKGESAKMKTNEDGKTLREFSPIPANEKNSAPETLVPNIETDASGFAILSEYQAGAIASYVMKWLTVVYDSCGAALSKPYRKYWGKFTRAFLSANDNDRAWISAARAGSGKTIWTKAFFLALCEIAVKDGELCQAIKGGVVFVVQKIETLNEMADVIEQWFPDHRDLIGVVQSFSPSGKKRGLCLNPKAASHDDCIPAECSFAESCSIVHSAARGRTALIAGITQARFLRYRRSDNRIHKLMYRDLGGMEVPRRFLIFDEKLEMAEISILSKEGLNSISNSFEQFGSFRNMADNKIAALQSKLTSGVTRFFDRLRWELRQEEADGRKRDYPFGFCTLRNDAHAATGFSSFCSWFSDPQNEIRLTQEGKECLDVMSDLLKEECLFVKMNGFRVIHITPPQLSFGRAQTLLFDATASIDGDYTYLSNVRVYENTPDRKFSNLTFHLFLHPGCNVSKTALRSPERQFSIRQLIDEIVANSTGKIFLSSYKEQNRMLFADGIPDQICQMDGGLPYYGGTNGSNDFRNCHTVILLGWPRLKPDDFFVNCFATWGEHGFREVVEGAFEAFQSDRIPGEPLRQLPMLKEYEARYLAARVEQEIYRSAIRLPDCKDEVHVYLFCPPEGVWPLLRERFPGCREDIIHTLPDCMQVTKGRNRKYQGAPTAYNKFAEFMEAWQGTEISVAALRDQELDISKSAWKDLLKDDRVDKLLVHLGITREGRGKNAKFIRRNPDAA